MAPPRKERPICQQCRVRPVRKLGNAYCSRECYAQARETGEHRLCAHCRTSFYAHGYLITAGHGQYCSPSCARAAARLARPLCAYCHARPIGPLSKAYCSHSHARLAAVARQREASPWPTCAVCDQPVKRRGRTYCSYQCSGRGRFPATQRRCPRPGCGRLFAVTGSYPDRKYCSNACAHLARRRRVAFVCARCDTPFEVPAAIAPGRRFCSRACWRGQGAAEIRACQACGKEKRWYPSQLKAGLGRYCDAVCKRKDAAAHRRHCAVCRKRLPPRGWEGRRFCSKACTYQGRGPRTRSTSVVERDARVVALRAEGWQGTRLQARLVAEDPTWWMGLAHIRQVLHRARGANAGAVRDKSNASGRRPVTDAGASA